MPEVISGLMETGTSLAGSAMTEASAAVEAAELASVFTANNIWMMLATALVFIMHLGFASVEAGFTQSKNTVNILYKNTLTLSHRIAHLCIHRVQPDVSRRIQWLAGVGRVRTYYA